MILTRLTLEEFGLYAGRQEFDLRPRPALEGPGKRPIILFGGMNGAGKTTLFEAVRLCLYGPLALGNRVKVADYQHLLSERIHRRPVAPAGPDRAAIELEFEHAHAGQLQAFRFRRSWERRKSGIVEQFTLWQDGQPLDNLDPAQWQDFVKELLPPGITGLFFFDGERIQALAEDEDHLQLAGAIKSLLGLDLVERLQTDLAIYAGKRRRGASARRANDDLAALQGEIESLEDELASCRQDRAQIEAQLSHLAAGVERQEQRISAEGGHFAAQREQLQERRGRLDAAIAQIEAELRQLCAGLLPFALAPGLVQALGEQLHREEEYQRWQATAELLSKQGGKLEAKLHSSAFWDELGTQLSEPQQAALSAKLLRLLERLVQPPAALQGLELVHQLSAPDRQRLLGWIEQSLSAIPRTLLGFSGKLEQLVREQRQVEGALGKAPSDDLLKPLLAELAELHRRLNALQTQAARQDEKIRQTNYRLEEAQRRQRKVETVLAQEDEGTQIIQRVSQVRSVLGVYLQQLTASKVAALCHTATDCFNRLCRKDNWIEYIAIDPHDFSVSLTDQQGQLIPKSQLSAGEKQIYAIAMLWALARLSGRPLPMMIDTPLGRLDSAHRRQLVERYFPQASHQLILLSTDTEVDQKFIKALQPHISHAYHLEYDPTEGRTRVREGYFWPLEPGEVSHADE